MKRNIYIALFTILGLLFGFFIHAILEMWYLRMLWRDFDAHNYGWAWETWINIHTYGTLALTIGFGLVGFFEGRRWWRILYVEQRYKKYLKRKLNQNF